MRSSCVSLLLVMIVAVLTGQAVHADEGRHLFILSGQSNMREPLPESFRGCVESVFGEDKVIVVTVAHPSQPIKQWYKDWKPPAGMTDPKPETNGSLYNKLLAAVEKATKDKPIATVTFIWMQGEADAGSGWGSVYEKSFIGILNQFKRDLKIDKINFVVGRINDFWTDAEKFPDGKLVRAVQQQLGEDHAHGDWIDTDDLNRGVNPWGGYSFEDGHFPPPGYRVMGQRFAKKACRLIDPERELEPGIFKEHFIDSAWQIKTHDAVNTLLKGPWLLSEESKAVKGVAALLDGRFGSTDPESLRWIRFPPSEKPIELVIDLGKPTLVDSIAVNTLIGTKIKAEFPDKMTYSTSVDGEEFTIPNTRYNNISFYNRKLLDQMRRDGIEPQALLLLTEQRHRGRRMDARYIKVTIHTGKQWVYIDEIIVNPVAKKVGDGRD